MPPVHRGLLAILLRKTQFLFIYGDIWWLLKNFLIEDGNGNVTGQVFHLMVDGEEWDWERAKAWEEDNVDWPEGAEIELELGRFTLIMMPRGSAKTTVAGIAVPVYLILYQLLPLGAYVSESGTHAEMQLENVRLELSNNARIGMVFGDLKPQISDDEKWNTKFCTTLTGMSLTARGRGAQIRGLNHKGQRPKLFIVDDLEDAENVESEVQREKNRKWFYGSLIPALPELDPEASINVLGTLLHPEALLETLRKDPEWTTVCFGCMDRDGQPLWPAYMDQKKAELKKQSFALAGQLHTFYLEYFNQKRTKETAPFDRDEFYVVEQPEKVMATVIYMDPAISEKKTADRCVIPVATINSNGVIYFQEIWSERGGNAYEHALEQYFLFHAQYTPVVCGIESVAFQKAIIHDMRRQMFARKQYFEIIPVKNVTAKRARILGVLLPRMSSGYVRFAKPFTEAESQCRDWNPTRKDQPDDFPDAMAGAISLLDDFAGLASPDHDHVAEATMPDLDRVLGDWRTV